MNTYRHTHTYFIRIVLKRTHTHFIVSTVKFLYATLWSVRKSLIENAKIVVVPIEIYASRP